MDTCLQPETYGLETWRKLSNRRAIAAPPGITAVGGRDDEGAIYNKVPTSVRNSLPLSNLQDDI